MSGTKRLLIAVAMMVLGVRCIIVPARSREVVVHSPPPAVVVAPPPGHAASPPPAQPGYISEGEAINIGIRYCQSHAFPCDLQEAHMTGDGIWKVKFKVRGGPGEGGHVHLDIDGRNGSMLRVDEKVKSRGGVGHH